ncbi:LuxR C-terminal-related transcriptional regulator [Kribbella sp. HUAS MG21]|uniref:LuxR C-terminal-related transcriptional regulator n=1 Tax=Kribbella sp. HUAS MG21 TaxID=3160966 RepID=A0AAU7T5Q1_9ACTN
MTRGRLHAALDLGIRSSLTLLVAPAGTGKTVLLSDWVARRRRTGDAVLWVPGHAPEALDRALRAPDRAEPPVPIVVDDAHLLPKEIVAELAHVLRHSPETVRVLLASRYDLPLPVPELELRGLALTLRAGDLRFTDAEATELVRAHAKTATAEDVQLFQRRTAGWAAALVLAARALAASGDAVWPLVTQRPVLDLLLGETLSTLDERVQAMLLSTFGAKDLTDRLAAMLSGDGEAGAMLADLAGNGLLVTAYADGADGEPVYRYHPLLVELLRRRTAADRDEAQLVVAAQHRSALYYENRGEGGTALRSALGADDPALVARILLVHGPELLAAGDLAPMAAGFEALPDHDLGDHPHLLGVRGLLRRVSGDVAGAVLDAASADQVLVAADHRSAVPEDDALEADATLLHLWESRYGWHDVRAAISRARALLTFDPAADRRRHRAVLGAERLAWLLIELAAAEIWADELDDALGHLDEAVVTARMAGHPRLIAGCLAHRAVVQHLWGQERSAAQSAQAALDAGGDDELPQEYAVRAGLVLGFAALGELDLDTAWHWYERVADADVADSDTVIAGLRVVLHGVLLIESGRLEDAMTALTADLASAGALPSFLSRDLALLRLRLAGLLGDQSGIETQIAELDRTGNASEATLIRAMLTICGGDPQETAAMIDEALKTDTHPPLASAAAGFRTALLAGAAGQPAVEASLMDTLHRVAPQRMLHVLIPAAHEPAFLDELRRHVGGPNPHPFASFALEKLSRHESSAAGPGGTASPARRHPTAAPPRRLEATVNGARIRLTAREAEVLDQLALGNSYSEIGQALFITENTVKTHLMSLYRKLGVEKRSAALRVARAAGLVIPRSG